MTDVRKKRGRPREREDLKRTPISIRTDPALKAQIKQLEERSGLSFTQAVERLLRLGLEHEGRSAIHR